MKIIEKENDDIRELQRKSEVAKVQRTESEITGVDKVSGNDASRATSAPMIEESKPNGFVIAP